MALASAFAYYHDYILFTPRGRTFYGRTNGTRKAMRNAQKRRRIAARLPK